MPTRYYAFGPFQLDPRAQLLLRDGTIVSLTPKALEILVVLVQNHGELVSKKELMEAVWPGVFVEETNLAQNISILRKSLGSDPEGHHYIETIPKRGYRFVAPVHEVSNGERQDAPAHPAPKPRPRWAALILLLSGLVVVFAAVSGILLRSGGELPHYRAVPLTTYPGLEIQASFSPDGNQVAFSWDGESQNNFDIYVMTRSAARPLRLTTDPRRDTSPAWSPDGQFIAFCRRLPDGRRGVFLTASTPAPERQVAEFKDYFFPILNRDLCWTPDGKYLIVTGRTADVGPAVLYLVPVSGGPPRPLTSPPDSVIGDSSPAISPNGHTLAFTRAINASLTALFLQELSSDLTPSGTATPIAVNFPNGSNPAWTADGNSIVFSAGWQHEQSLWRIPVGGLGLLRSWQRPERLSEIGDHAMLPAISPSGRYLAYSRSVWELNIYRIDLPGAGMKAEPPVRVAASTRLESGPVYSPDGQKIAFRSDRSGTWEIWVCDRDGMNPIQLTFFGGPENASPEWSPDGRQIAFVSHDQNRSDIYIVSTEGGAPRRLSTGSQASDAPQWSHDGKWIYFATPVRGTMQVWKLPSAGGQAVQVTRQGGFFCKESPDGKQLYYSKSRKTDTSIWTAPVDGGEEKEVLPSVTLARNFAVTNSGIYFVPATSLARADAPWSLRGGLPVYMMNFKTGEIRVVAETAGPIYSGLSVSPDEKSILYSQVDGLNADLVLVENFH